MSKTDGDAFYLYFRDDRGLSHGLCRSCEKSCVGVVLGSHTETFEDFVISHAVMLIFMCRRLPDDPCLLSDHGGG